MVAQNSSGEVISGLNRRFQSNGVEVMKASTILEGMKLADERGWTIVEIE